MESEGVEAAAIPGGAAARRAHSAEHADTEKGGSFSPVRIG